MKSIRKILSYILVIVLVLTSVQLSVLKTAPVASAEGGANTLMLNRPKAGMSVTEVTRVAYAVNTMKPPSGSNSAIVKATPSGIPYISGPYASKIYAGETPAATQIRFTPGVTLSSQPTVSCSNTTVKFSSASLSNGTYTWQVESGTATVGTSLIFTVSYEYKETNTSTGKEYVRTYQTQAVSYVESILVPAGIYSSKRTYENWGVYTKTQNRSYIGSLVLGKNVYGGVYNNGSGNGCIDFCSSSWVNAGYWTNEYGNMKDFSDSDSSRQYNVAFKADGSRPISYIYFDKSLNSTLSDINLRFCTYIPNQASDDDERVTVKVEDVWAKDGVVNTFSESSGEETLSSDTTAVNELRIGSYTGSIKTIGSMFTLNFSGNGPTGTASQKDYTVAIRYRTEAGWSNIHVGHSFSLRIMKYDKGALRNLVEDIQNTDPTSVSVNLESGEFKGYNPQSWYYESGYENFLTALNSARACLAKPDVTQADINSAYNTLTTAYGKLKLAKADYTLAASYYNLAMSKNPKDYSISSWAKLQTALDNYRTDYSAIYQPAVDKVAIDIKNALSTLEFQSADYSELLLQLAAINRLVANTPFDYGLPASQAFENWSKLESVLENAGCIYNELDGYTVAEYLPVSQQSTVDGYVLLIDSALSTLTLKKANYSAANIAEGTYNILTISYIVDDIATYLTDAYNSLVALHGLDISHQAEIDAATANLNYWLNQVEYKPANTEKAEELIAYAYSIDRSLYSDFSSVDSAIDRLQSSMMNDIRYQDEIDRYTLALQSALDKLITNSADYTEVDNAIEAANEIANYIIRTYEDTYGFTAKTFYSNWTLVENAINGVVRHLDSNQQPMVDGYANSIYTAIDSLIENQADYTEVSKLQSAASVVLSSSTSSSLYTAESLTALRNAYLAVTPNIKISQQALVDIFASDLQKAYDGLTYLTADYSSVNQARATAKEKLDENDAFNDAHPGYNYFTPETVSALNLALASVIEDLDVRSQSEVNGYASAINDAISKLEYGPADYEQVNLALLNVPTDLSIYTTLSVTTLNLALNKINKELTAYDQPTVDNYVSTINNAIGKLKLKPADYTQVNNAKKRVPASSATYTPESWANLQEALSAVVTGLDITHQAEVDNFALAINTAVDYLVLLSADYSGVYQAIASVPQDLELYTDATAKAVNDAVDAVVYNLDITHQSQVNGYAAAINTALSKLTYKDGDYSGVQTAIAEIPENLSDYTDETASAVTSAVNAVVYGLDITHQDEISGYAIAIHDAVQKLVIKNADYSSVSNAISKVPSDLSIYTDETATAVTSAVNAVVYGLDITHQSEVNGFANAINDAVSKLTIKPADYSAVSTAIEKVPSDLSIYTDETANAVTSAVNAVVYDLDITHQSEVNGFANAINDAVSKLTIKPADYSAVTTAIEKVPSDLSIYTDETANAVTSAVNAVVYNLDITHQSEVNGFANAINDAVSKLTYKPADYSKAEEAISAAIEKISTGWYTDETVIALQNAINALTPNLDITKQAEIDVQTENIVKATNDLMLKSANYTDLEKIIELLDNPDSEIYNKSYSNFNEVMSLIVSYRENTVSKNMNLTIDKQAIVDEMAATLQGYIDSLELAETFALNENYTATFTESNGEIYITGIPSGLTKEAFLNDYIVCDGVTATLSKSRSTRFIGTGTRVTVKSDYTGEVIAEYTIVLYGDVNGDSLVDIYDMHLLNEYAGMFEIDAPDGFELAANIQRDEMIDFYDVNLLYEIASGLCVISTLTGEISK